MSTGLLPPVAINGKEYSRTHQHYMAAVRLFNGESEAMVAEMYDFALGLERELAALRDIELKKGNQQ